MENKKKYVNTGLSWRLIIVLSIVLLIGSYYYGYVHGLKDNIEIKNDLSHLVSRYGLFTANLTVKYIDCVSEKMDLQYNLTERYKFN